VDGGDEAEQALGDLERQAQVCRNNIGTSLWHA